MCVYVCVCSCVCVCVGVCVCVSVCVCMCVKYMAVREATARELSANSCTKIIYLALCIYRAVNEQQQRSTEQ